MKKSLLVWLVLVLWATLSGCKFFQISDWDWMERKIQYPIAEQECIDNDGELSTDDDWNQICLFEDWMQCPLVAIEEWDCFLINQWGWERITVVTDMCNEQWWEIQQWNEWWDTQDICFFPDESFCYLEDLAAWACEKWDMKYYDDNLYIYAEQACLDNNGQLSQTEDGEDICILNDEDFCYMSDVMDWGCDLLYQDMLDIQDMHESERAYQEYVAECYDQPQITVCGEDWITYYNKCFMEKAGVQEETELAQVVDWECIYG